MRQKYIISWLVAGGLMTWFLALALNEMDRPVSHGMLLILFIEIWLLPGAFILLHWVSKKNPPRQRVV